MEAEYVAYYLGSAMLNKGTTGLGVIQKPLREKYFAFRKSADNKLGPEVAIRINPSGIVLAFTGTTGQYKEEFYPIPSIHFIEAVRFVTIGHKDKKFSGAFVPIDETKAINTNQDKLFEPIDKKFKHLTKISHPPMLACVMRRPTGVKAVDLHMFVIPVVEDALHMANMVQRYQHFPGEYIDHPPGGHLPSGRYDNVFPNPDVIPREFGAPPRDIVNKRDSNEHYEIYRGRGVELRQDHFMNNDRGPPDSYGSAQGRGIDRDVRPDYGRGPGERYGDPDERNRYAGGLQRGRGEVPRDNRGDKAIYPRRGSVEIKTGTGVYIERDSLGREYEFDNQITHERQRSGGDTDYGKQMGKGPRGPEYTGNYPPNRPRELSPDGYRGGPPRGYREEQLSSRQPYGDPIYKRQGPGPGPVTSPRGRSPPRGHSPTRNQPSQRSPRAYSPEKEEENVYSFSNLESRLEAENQGKPVAKVPPHRHAGIRVLPSLPIPGAKNQLKPVSPRTSEDQNKPEKPPVYNFNPTTKVNDDDRPYDDRRIPYGDGRKDRIVSDSSYVPVEHRAENSRGGDQERVKSDGYNYGNGYGNDKRHVQGHDSGPQRQWSYEEEKDKFVKSGQQGWNGGYKSKSDVKNRSYGSEHSDEHVDSKDAEIANMFAYLHTENTGREDDFEQSLGYLP